MEITSQLGNVVLSDAIKHSVAAHTTLEKLLLWSVNQTPAVMIGEIIAQDEFTNDIIVPFNAVFLVYDTT